MGTRFAQFRAQYLQLLDVNDLNFPPIKILKQPEIQARIYDEMFNADLMQYMPPSSYQLRVLKALTKRIEEAISDPEEDVGFSYFYHRSLHIIALCNEIS